MIINVTEPIVIQAAPGYAGALVRLIQGGNGTAVIVTNKGNNPCLKLMAMGNAACLELEQTDGEDSVSAVGSDVRCRTLIGSLASVIDGHSHRYIDGDPNGQETGHWGDVYWLRSPGATGPIAWVCLEDGSTWRALG